MDVGGCPEALLELVLLKLVLQYHILKFEGLRAPSATLTSHLSPYIKNCPICQRFTRSASENSSPTRWDDGGEHQNHRAHPGE